MPKSQIIKDIVEDSVSLDKSLSRLLVLAKDIGNKTLSKWAENELNGYKNYDDVPDYRRTSSFLLKYSGLNGNFQVTNLPLPKGWIRDEVVKTISTIAITDGIHYIENLAKNEQGAAREMSALAGDVSTATGGEVICTSIHQIIPQTVYQSVCSEVKNKMIAALMELEKKYGNLDRLGIDISDKKPTQIERINADLNRVVFNISLPQQETKKERWYSKVAWKIAIPILTAVVGAVLTAVVIKHFKL